MKELTRNQKIELYDLIYPDSLEDDYDIKVNDMTDYIEGREPFIIFWPTVEKISSWMTANSYKSCPPVLGDYDVWYQPCAHCHYDEGKSTLTKNGNKTCWKCGHRRSGPYSC